MPSSRVVVIAALNGLIMSCALSPANARTHHHRHTASNHHHEWQHDAFRYESYHYAFRHRHLTTASSARWSCSWWCWETERLDRYNRPHTTRHSFSHERSRTNRLAGAGSVNGSLGAKAREIVQSCGSTVISDFRPGARIAGLATPPCMPVGGPWISAAIQAASTPTSTVGRADTQSITARYSTSTSRSVGMRTVCAFPTIPAIPIITETMAAITSDWLGRRSSGGFPKFKLYLKFLQGWAKAPFCAVPTRELARGHASLRPPYNR